MSAQLREGTLREPPPALPVSPLLALDADGLRVQGQKE